MLFITVRKYSIPRVDVASLFLLQSQVDEDDILYLAYIVLSRKDLFCEVSATSVVQPVQL
jgi:hypothetical protein